MTPRQDLIGVLDVGKTNVKLALVDAHTGKLTWQLQRSARTLDTPLVRCLDVAGIEEWIIASLAGAPGRERIRFLVPIAHGATAALVDREDAVIAVPDYEAAAFDSVAQPYRAIRDAYEATGSPFLPLGLNLGRQLFFLQTKHPAAFGRATRILLHPQFWAWRLCGIAASEVTSLGCHTDLWRPAEHRHSAMAERRGWASLLPPLRRAHDVLGPITAGFAQATGLDPQCRVLCGIHDSNASYLCHAAVRPDASPLTVVSSGTWVVVMARGTDLARLSERDGMLANVDAHDQPVATARFMGGRAYAAIAGPEVSRLTPDRAALARVVQRRAMALPPCKESDDPAANTSERLIDAKELSATERAALASLYCALQVDLILEQLAARGEVIIEGPLAADPLFAKILAALRPASAVLVSDGRVGMAMAATILAGLSPRRPVYVRAAILDLDELSAYRTQWRVSSSFAA